MKPKEITNLEEIIIVCDYMDSDLHDVIRINADITLKHRQFFMY